MRPDSALNGVVGRYVRKQSIRKGRQITAFPRTWIMIGPSHLGRPSRAKHTMLLVGGYLGGSRVNWLLQWLRAPWTSSKRAQRRLIQVLTPEQCRDYRRSGLFIIDSQLGHRYLVGDGCRVRQLELDDCVGWRPTTAYCFMPASDEQVPQPDADTCANASVVL